ncbi:MAG: hypothetical protein P8Y21_09285 [Gemmatimonadales bacterium]
MKRLRAIRRRASMVAALAIGLAACTSDSTGPAPTPPPPPPPNTAAVSITGVVDPETGQDLPQSGEGIMVSGRIGVLIDFDPGSSSLQSLDVVFEDASGATEEVPCAEAAQASLGRGAIGLRPDVQSVQCVIDTGEGAGACQGQAMSARFANGVYTVSAELTLQDGATAADDGEDPLIFDNGEATGGMALDVGPRVVSVGDDFPDFGVEAGVGFWGGPRDLSWRACPVVFDPALTDICRIEIGPGQRASSEAPFTYTAAYRDADGEPVNEGLIEDDPTGGGHVIGDGPTGFRVFLCDGTNVTEFFDMGSDVRHLDTTAPSCSGGSCAPEIMSMAVLQNGLYSDGAITLGGLSDGGVGGTYGVTTIVDAYEFDSGNPADQEIFLENPEGIVDLPEDDGCGSGETTDSAVQLGCGGTEAGLPVDAYFLMVSEVADLLGNALGDGNMDREIDDEFSDSDEFGVDRTAPSLEDLAPPEEDPLFVWNPDLTGSGCPAAAPGSPDCETIMWESLDPDLASGDDPSGVEAGSCGAVCADDDGDGHLIEAEILASPGGGSDDEHLSASNAGLGPDMFEAFFCGGGGSGAECDGTDDGEYSVEVRTNDQAVKDNNVRSEVLDFVLDVTPPVVGFGGITGLNSSNAASVNFVLDAVVTDRNGDGTAVADATVQVTIDGGDGTCDGTGGGDDSISEADVLVSPNDDSSGATVTVDVTDQVNANGGAFEVTFTAQNQDGTLGLGTYDYCFILTGDDGARRKDGSEDGIESTSSAQKTFTWQ